VRSTVPLSRMGKEQYGEPTVPPPHTGVPRADTDASAVLVHRGLGRLIRVACSRAGSSRLTGVGTGRRLAGGRTSPCPCPKRPGGSSAAGARRVDAGAGGPVTRSLGRATSAGSVYGASCKKCSSDVRLLVADDGASLLRGRRSVSRPRGENPVPAPIRSDAPSRLLVGNVGGDRRLDLPVGSARRLSADL